MKTLFALSLALVSTAAFASPAVTCYEYAGQRTNLSPSERIELCRGAKDNSSVSCYEYAGQRTNLSPIERVQLCRASNN